MATPRGADINPLRQEGLSFFVGGNPNRCAVGIVAVGTVVVGIIAIASGSCRPAGSGGARVLGVSGAFRGVSGFMERGGGASSP